jgi:hypothetical protein
MVSMMTMMTSISTPRLVLVVSESSSIHHRRPLVLVDDVVVTIDRRRSHRPSSPARDGDDGNACQA